MEMISATRVLDVLNVANDMLWTYVVIVLLVFCAIYFTIRLRGVQFRMLKEMWRVMLGRDRESTGSYTNGQAGGGRKQAHYPDREADKRRISSFGAFAVSLSSRVGTGNLAGVASAIFVGGPGAVFGCG